MMAELRERFTAQRGIWDKDWEALMHLSPAYLKAYLDLQEASQKRCRLTPKVQEFVHIAVAACCTHIYVPAIRAHITAALRLGATKDELMEVIGLTYLVGIHTVTLGAPILLELMEEEGIKLPDVDGIEDERKRIKQEFIDQRGFWTDTWNPLLELDPTFFGSYTDFSSLPSKTGVLEPKVREIVVCAFDAATTHLYGRGTKIHMRNALRLGATPDEIMEMLEITSLMGIHGVTAAAPIVTSALESLSTGSGISGVNGNDATDDSVGLDGKKRADLPTVL